MALGDKAQAKLFEEARRRVSVPVVAVAVLSPKGRLGATMAGGLIGQAIHSSSHQAHGFASHNLFVVSDWGVHVWEAGQGMAGYKVKDRKLGEWPWGSFSAASQAGGMSRFLFLYWPDGQVSELEALMGMAGNKWQGEAVDEIARRSAAALGYAPVVPAAPAAPPPPAAGQAPPPPAAAPAPPPPAAVVTPPPPPADAPAPPPPAAPVTPPPPPAAPVTPPAPPTAPPPPPV